MTDEAKRFRDLTKKIVSVPKKDVDRKLEEERQQKAKDKKRKA